MEIGVQSEDLLEDDPVSLSFVGQFELVDCLLLVIVLDQAEHSSTAASLDGLDAVDLPTSHGRCSVALDESELQRSLFKFVLFQLLSIIKLDSVRTLAGADSEDIDLFEAEHEHELFALGLEGLLLLIIVFHVENVDLVDIYVKQIFAIAASQE